MNDPTPIPSPPLHSAPRAHAERPPSTMCSECGELVEPIAVRAGWYSLTAHRACRQHAEARLQAAEDGAAASEALCSGDLARYAGLSLLRTVRLQADRARSRDGLRSAVADAQASGLLIETPHNAAALRVLRGWHPGKSVVLEGPVGTGKTALLLAWAQDQLRTVDDGPKLAAGYSVPQHRRVRYFTAGGLAGWLARSLRARPQDDPIDLALTTPLVVDDLGAEVLGGYRRDEWEGWLGELVDRAYLRRLPLLVGSNLTSDGIIERYPGPGERMVSRLRQMCGHGTDRPRWVQVGGISWREVGA
jgi:DNA replication protein DnaC